MKYQALGNAELALNLPWFEHKATALGGDSCQFSLALTSDIFILPILMVDSYTLLYVKQM